MPRMNEISLMFSGGVDSTVAALHLAGSFERVHLLTFSNGYGHYGFQRTRKRAEELMARAPGRFVYHFESVAGLFREIAVASLAEDYARFQSGFIWCMGCKLAMHTASVRYDLAHGLTRHTDGSSADTAEMVEQMLISLSLVSHFYQDNGISFEPTDYDLGRDAKRELLKTSGFRMGIPLRDRYLGIQPSCVAGELYYLPYLLLKRPPRHPERMVAEYITSRRPIMDRLVREVA
jgi:signal transduction histidine kinase